MQSSGWCKLIRIFWVRCWSFLRIKQLEILSSPPRETPDFLAGPTDQPPGGGEPVHPVPLHTALQEQGHLLSDMDTHQYRPGTNTQYIRQAHHTEKHS